MSCAHDLCEKVLCKYSVLFDYLNDFVLVLSELYEEVQVLVHVTFCSWMLFLSWENSIVIIVWREYSHIIPEYKSINAEELVKNILDQRFPWSEQYATVGDFLNSLNFPNRFRQCNCNKFKFECHKIFSEQRLQGSRAWSQKTYVLLSHFQ